MCDRDTTYVVGHAFAKLGISWTMRPAGQDSRPAHVRKGSGKNMSRAWLVAQIVKD